MKCRHCQTDLRDVFIDLGAAPPSNAFLRPDDLDRPELHFPLKVFTCHACRLVQIDEVQRHDEIFSNDYVYFSSYSSSWLAHARAYVDRVTERLGLGPRSFVMEIASNDGYLLQNVRERGIPCVGIEPTGSTAAVARGKGIESVERFFGHDFAREFVQQRGKADLILGNNVYAHVPDINDFTAGLQAALAPAGTVTLEFPHLLRLVEENQYDTIYHEHYSYLSLGTVRRILAMQGLTVWDVEQLPTHGGSLRVWAQHATHDRPVEPSVAALLAKEAAAGMEGDGFYAGFQARAERIKDDLVAFLIEQKRAGRTVAAYGAAAKGNTMLNHAGVRPDLIRCVADASPHKQGRFMPGSRIPVVSADELRALRPDVVLILPWNLRDEIATQLADIRAWGGRFAVAIPSLQLL